MSNLIFIAPRFHTNQFFLTKYLKQISKQLIFLVEHDRGVINSTFVEPVVMNRKRLLKFIEWYSIPSYLSVYNNENTTVVIRDPFYFKTLFYLYHFRNSNIRFYSQVDISTISFESSLLYKFYCRIFKAKWISPIQSGTMPTRLANYFFFIPFVVDFLPIRHVKSDRKLRIGIVAKFQPRKNIYFLISALLEVKLQCDVSFEFVLIGSYHDNDGYMMSKTIESCLESTILDYEFHVNKDHHECLTLIKSLDLFVLPSYNEPAAFSIVEALSFGVPVVLSSDCGNSSYIKEDLGYIFQRNSISSLIDCILAFIFDPKIKDKLAISRSAENYFSVAANHLNIRMAYNV